MKSSLTQLVPCLALLASATASATSLAADEWAVDSFCTDVQRLTTATPINSSLVIHKTSAAYRASKPAIEPVVIHQYVTPDATGQPKMISCKVKTVDHLQAAYGPQAAGRQGTCEEVTRVIAARAQSIAPSGAPALVIEPDERVWTGSSYLAAFELLSRDASGTLHVHTRYMRIDWEDWRWYVMPTRLRGHLYCHLIAPEYLGRLLAGETPELQPIDIPPAPDPD